MIWLVKSTRKLEKYGLHRKLPIKRENEGIGRKSTTKKEGRAGGDQGTN